MSSTWTEEPSCSKNKSHRPIQPCPQSLTCHYPDQVRDVSLEDCHPSVETSKAGRNGSVQKRKHRKKRALTGVSQQRRAANDRERRRNLKVNKAFINLKNSLPLPHIHISKIEILRYAIKWIDHLGTLLKDYDEQKDLLKIIQMETSRSNEHGQTRDDWTHVKDDGFIHELPDFRNALWEECIGLPDISSADNEGCIHIKTKSRFHDLFS